MGIRGASIELKNGKTISVESEDDAFTGDLSARDQKQLARELKRKIGDKYDGESVELAKGAKIVMYESATGSRWTPSFWDYLFRAPITKYTEIQVDPSETSLIESGAARLYGTKAPLPEPTDRELDFFEKRLPDVIKNNKDRFADIQGTFRINVEKGATWVVKFPQGDIAQASKEDNIAADCTIGVSQSALKKVMNRDFAITSYLLDRPDISGDEALAKRLGWLLKELV